MFWYVIFSLGSENFLIHVLISSPTWRRLFKPALLNSRRLVVFCLFFWCWFSSNTSLVEEESPISSLWGFVKMYCMEQFLVYFGWCFICMCQTRSFCRFGVSVPTVPLRSTRWSRCSWHPSTTPLSACSVISGRCASRPCWGWTAIPECLNGMSWNCGQNSCGEWMFDPKPWTWVD